MSTKNTKKNNTGSKEKISLVSTKEYNRIFNKSGSPVLKNNEANRLYSNDRINGTTKVLIAALVSVYNSENMRSEYTVDELQTGLNNLSSDNFKNIYWRRLQESFKSERSDLNKKYKRLRSFPKEFSGVYKGIDYENLGSDNIRAHLENRTIPISKIEGKKIKA